MNTSKPTFSIYRADGSKVPGLKKSFLIKEILTSADIIAGQKTLPDGTQWTLVLDTIFEEEVFFLGKEADNKSFYCICSYQAHEHGNFVVARLCKERQTHKEAASKEQKLKGSLCLQMHLALA
jgi:hypothetical protein